MITENGSIKVATPINLQVQKELNANSMLVALILTVIGAVGVAAAFGWYLAFVIMDKPDTVAFVVLVIFAASLGGGIGLLCLVKKAQKTVMGAKKVDTCEFFSDHFDASETLNGEQVANIKIYYNQIIRAKETKNYIFIYIHAQAAYPVSKEGLTDAELERLRAIFRLKPGVKN